MTAKGVSTVATLVPCTGVVSPLLAANHDVEVRNNFFSPKHLTLQVGDTVTWTLIEGIHNVRADDGSFRCARGCDATGGIGDASNNWTSITLSFDATANIPYFCEPHGDVGGVGMAGTLTVESVAPQPTPTPDDNGDLRFTDNLFIEPENGGNAILEVERVKGSNGAVGVSYATSNGSGTAGQDYTSTTGNLSWADGESGAKSFTVSILDDDEDEKNETVKVALAAPTGGAALGNPSRATIRITDNDTSSSGALQFTSSTFSVGEGEGMATLSVSREGGTDGNVSADYDTADGFALAGDDYTAVSGTLDWSDGDSADKSFDIPIFDDVDPEFAETLLVSLAAASGGASLGSPTVATLTINNNDGPIPCDDAELSVCLLDRFLVTIHFETNDGSMGDARAFKLTESAASFEFFEAGNVEIVVKMKDTCTLPDGHPLRNFWVFIAGLTNVRVEITIVDTVTGTVRKFINELNQPFFTAAPESPDGQANPPGAIQATTAALGAFPTCDL